MSESISRRDFLKKGSVATLGLSVVPSTVLGQKWGHTAPSDKMNIVGVGIGGMGFHNLKNLEKTENIIGLADVDWRYSAHVFKHYPKAKAYYDYRRMYDELGKSIDGVVVATADHTHAIIAAEAIVMGKHTLVQKPLTHSVYESRLLTKLTEKYKVATQMGNQGASAEGVRQVCEWIWNGEIGEVKKVEAFTDRPIWPQGLGKPSATDKMPKTLNWDVFIGPAKYRPYNQVYTPWNWRGWWDYGTGALGDMACHILHPVFKSLDLKYPIKVQGNSTMLMSDSAPQAQTVSYIFPARPNRPNVAMPAVEIIWYDGGLQPLRPEGMPQGRSLNDAGGGVIFHGTKDTLICGCYGARPWLLSGRLPNAPKVLREIKISDDMHEMDWVRACKESPEYRIEASSSFNEAGPFNEMVVMGVLGTRLQSLNQILDWDGENMRFTNIPKDAKIQSVVRDGFKLNDGHPTFDRTMTEPIDANVFAEELIKHTYRDGWKLPDMPT